MFEGMNFHDFFSFPCPISVSVCVLCMCMDVCVVCLQLDPCLHLYSVNGKLLLSEAVDQTLTSLLVHQQFLVTGGQTGQVLFRDLFV